MWSFKLFWEISIIICDNCLFLVMIYELSLIFFGSFSLCQALYLHCPLDLPCLTVSFIFTTSTCHLVFEGDKCLSRFGGWVLSSIFITRALSSTCAQKLTDTVEGTLGSLGHFCSLYYRPATSQCGFSRNYNGGQNRKPEEHQRGREYWRGSREGYFNGRGGGDVL